MGSRHVAKDTPAAIKLERDDFIIANDDHEKHANLPDPLSEFDDAVASSGHEIPLPNIFSSPFKNAPLPPVADTFQSPSKAPSQPDEYPLPGTNSPVKPEPLLSVSAPSDIKPSLSSPPISVVAMPTLTPSPGKKKHSHHNALRLKAHQQAQAGGSKKLRCVCEFIHDDGFLVQCNKCYAWQHIDCFYPNASSRPVAHRCHVCVPRYVNVEDAKQIQAKKLDDRRGGGFKLNGHGGMAISIPSALPASSLGVSMSTAMSVSSASGLIATSSVSSSASAKLMNVAKRSLPNSVSSITEATVSRLSSGVTVASVVRRVAASAPLNSPLQYSTGTTTASGVDANRSSKRKQSLQMRSTPDPMLMHTEEEIKLALMERVASRASRYKSAERNRYTEDLYRILYRINKATGATKHTLLAEMAKRECDTIITEDNTIGVASPATYSVYDTVLEYRGELMTKEEYLEKHDPTKEYNPYVLFYSGLPNLTIVADASKYGNEARFIRRSCRPNCEVKHAFGDNSRLHLIIWATQKIVPGREITIPFDFDFTQCSYEMNCPCSKKTCEVRRHGTQIRMNQKRIELNEIVAKRSKLSTKAEKKEKAVKSEPAFRPVECKVKLERLELDASGAVITRPDPPSVTQQAVRSESPMEGSCALPRDVSRLRNDAEARANLTARLQERLSPNKGSPGSMSKKNHSATSLRGPPAFARLPIESASPARSFNSPKGPMAARKRSRKQQLVAIRNPFSEEHNASSEEEESQGSSFWKS